MKKYKRLFESENIKAYHGSKYDFDKFDSKFFGKQNDPGDYGEGFYFDTNKDWAKSYGQQGFLYTCILFLKNPYIIDFKKYSDFKNKLRSREIDSKLSNEEIEKYQNALRKGGITIPFFDPDSSIYQRKGFLDLSRHYKPKNITKALIKAGYDSVIINYGTSKEIVVFNVKNIKIIEKEKL